MIKLKKIEHNIRKCFPDLINTLKQDKDIIAIYLFGSYAAGNEGPLSDVDIAILLDRVVPEERYLDIELELMGKIDKALKTEEVSLVLLNSAPLTIQYGVLKNAKLLYCRDNTQRISFETKTLDMYFDFRPLLAQYDKVMHRQILEGRIYGR